MTNDSDTALKRRARRGIGIVGAVLVIYEGLVVPLGPGAATISAHHWQHTILVLGAGLLAMALTARLPGDRRERTGWIWPAVLAPMAILALMWPSSYAFLTAHVGWHLLDHLGLALCGFLTVLGAQVYVRGLGWATLVLLVGMCAATAGGYGVSPGLQNILSDEPANAAVSQVQPATRNSVVMRVAAPRAPASAPTGVRG